MQNGATAHFANNVHPFLMRPFHTENKNKKGNKLKIICKVSAVIMLYMLMKHGLLGGVLE
jgi:hypothetical protein